MYLQGFSRRWILILTAVVVGLMVACTCVPPTQVSQAGKPTVTIIAPAEGAEFPLGQAISVQVLATDSQGISRVTLSVGGGLVDTVNSPSPQPSFNATLTWTPNVAGVQVLVVQAYNVGSTASDPAIVRVNVGGGGPGPGETLPVIVSFSASPPSITAGDSSTLSWNVSGATSVEIDHGIGPVALSGSQSVSPASTTTYLLTAHGPGGDATATATVTVNPASGGTPPVINSFVASPPSITAGDSSTLSWNVSGATSVEIDHGIGPVALSGSQSVSPASTTTYLLTAHGPGGDATATATITVNPATAIIATITYHSYDAASGWVTFQIVNHVGGATLESARVQIINRSTGANYYGPSTSDSPFRDSPTSDALVDSMATGTKYMRYRLGGNPTGVPCRATITLYTGEGSSGVSSTKTVDFDLPGAAGINATVTYHSYDAATGWVTFRIVNNAGGATLECVRGEIKNRSTNATYYGPSYSDSPFRTSPTQESAGESSMAAGQTRYLRFKLSGNPTGVPCRATITLYTGNGQTGTSQVKTVDFDLPGAAGINATITYHSYDAATGWVTFRIVNNAGGATLECVRGEIKNRSTNATYYGPSYSDSPFRTSPTQESAGESSMAAGQTRYLRFKLSGNPTGVPCRATITLYTGNGQTGTSQVKTVDFDLPGAAGINATITAYSYNASTGEITFRIVNTGGVAIECAQTQVVNRNTNANYYGPAYSNSIFRSTPTGSLGSNVPVGATRYMVYILSGRPTGVPCRATITIYSADNRGGSSVTKTVDFNLS